MILLLDIDDTISDGLWREHLLPDNGGSWDLFHGASHQDLPVNDMAVLIRSLKSAGWAVVGITGRSEKWRQMTVAWMVKHNIPIDELLMRPDDDFRKAAIVKAEQAEPFLADPETVVIAIDDNESNVAAYRERNITVMQVFVKRGPKDEDSFQFDQQSA